VNEPEVVATSEGRRSRIVRQGDALSLIASRTGVSVEQLKRWKVLPEVWSPDEGSLTPTLKVKRAHVEARHQALLDSLYAEERVKIGT
jgi:long-chain acyl-CoA synthetase